MAVTAPDAWDDEDPRADAWGEAANADFNSLDARLTTAEGKLTDTGWTAPVLSPGWASFAGATVRWRRLYGRTEIEGIAQNNSGGTKGAGDNIFPLPIGSRPGGQKLVNTVGIAGRIEIDGVVRNNANVGANNVVGLHITFIADN